MKVKTNTLTGAALDWAVAKCDGTAWLFEVLDGTSPLGASYCTDWALGGPIIEEANITTIRADDEYEVDAKGFSTSKRIPCWFAECSRWTGHSLTTSYEGESMEPTFMIGKLDGCYGPTPLTAAMRCYVSVKLGDEVDIPQELL